MYRFLEVFMSDNIDARYKPYKDNPSALKKALLNLHNKTENTYSVFREVIQEHPDIGKAAIVIMATNFASHLMKIACDNSKHEVGRICEISNAIAPMYELLYDRLTRETIETLEDEFEDEENN